MTLFVLTLLLLQLPPDSWEGSETLFLFVPGPGIPADPMALEERNDHSLGGLCRGWPVDLGSPGAGFPYTPTLFDLDGDGDMEIFLTGGETFGLDGDGEFLPGWPVSEMAYMGYGTNAQLPGPSCGDTDQDGDFEVMWSERDWYAGSAHMWSFNGRESDGTDMPGMPQSAPDQSSNALASPFVTADADGDGDLEAWSAHTLGNTGDYYRISGFDHLGNRLFTTDLDPQEDILNLYFGQLDGSGEEEFFAVGVLDGIWLLHCFNEDGEERTGYPVQLMAPSGASPVFGPPVPCDLDADGDLEFLIGYNVSATSFVDCRHHDGTQLPGYPMTVSSDSQLFYIGLGDITGDGWPELLAMENQLSGDYRVWAFETDTGLPLSGWPYPVPDWPKGFPTVADLDGDGIQDVCFVTDGGELYALSGYGTPLIGYPRTMASPSISGAAVGDIDGDGLLEVVAATWDGLVYAWDTEGASSVNADWPMRGIDARNSGVFTISGGSGLEVQLPCVNGLAVSENPSRGPVMFIPDVEVPSILEIFDLTGRTVYSVQVSGRGPVLWYPGDTVTGGVYLARLSSAGVELGSVRVVLIH